MTTDITELAQSHELLIANGQQTADLLRHLADNEIDSDYFAVVSECESYGKETDAELSITEFALRAAGYVDALVEALEKAQATEAHCNRGWIEAHEQEARAEAAEQRIAELEDAEQKLCAANVTLDARAELAERQLAELESRLNSADKLQDSAFRSGLQHGFSLGQTDDQKGYEHSMAAYSPAAGIREAE